MQKGSQDETKMDFEIFVFSYLFEKVEICEFVLPPKREHDFRDYGHLEMHELSTQSQHRINARKRHAKSMENNAKMEPKLSLKSFENLKICEKKHAKH